MTVRKSKVGLPLPDEDVLPVQEGIEIDVSNIVIPPPEKPSLKERLLGKSDDEPKKPVSKSKKSSSKSTDPEKTYALFRSTLPMTLAAMFAMQSKRLFREEYKPCAPNRDEVAEVLLPIFNLISRRIEITGKVTQDVEDIAACILASMTLGIRMLMTAQEIRDYGQQLTPTERASTSDSGIGVQSTSNNNGRNGRQSTSSVPADTATYGHYTSQSVAIPRSNGGYDATSNGYDSDGTFDNESWERVKVADLLRKDTLGRRQMGLAPRLLRDNDRAID